MSITAIRKTKLPYKGGPGAAGIRFDPVTHTLKVHDGVTESVVGVRSESVTVATGAVTVTKADHGKTIVADAAASVVVNLPSAASAKGMALTVVVKQLPGSGAGTTLNPVASDTIKFGTANKDLINSAATDALGDSVTVVSDGGTNWNVVAQVGIWAKEA